MKTISPKNQIIYDWLSFTTKIHTLGEVLDLLDFRPDTVVFKEQEKGGVYMSDLISQIIEVLGLDCSNSISKLIAVFVIFLYSLNSLLRGAFIGLLFALAFFLVYQFAQKKMKKR